MWYAFLWFVVFLVVVWCLGWLENRLPVRLTWLVDLICIVGAAALVVLAVYFIASQTTEFA